LWDEFITREEAYGTPVEAAAAGSINFSVRQFLTGGQLFTESKHL